VAGWVGDEASLGGLYLCDDSACTPTALLAENWFPKSLFVDGTTLWATVVDTTTLAATLWRIDGGADPAAASLELSSFEAVHEWPLGDSDPRVYFASGERVDLWVRPRSGESAPSYQQSFDGGASFEATFETGYYSDPVPGVLIRDAGGTILLGSYYGARTWRSIDAGQSFEEVSAEVPALRCGLDLAPGSASGRSLICADHLADGFDVAATDDGSNFTAVACFEEVVAADCAAETCDGAYEAWSAAAAYGGGECGVDTASDDSGDTGKAEPECGCANGASSSLLPMLAGVGLLWWRVRTAAGSIR
jgi:hypothetical protein